MNDQISTAYAASAYLCASILLMLVIASSIRRSEFGILLAGSEGFYLVSVGLYPLLFNLGLVPTSNLIAGFISAAGLPGADAATHILFYSLGSACGYFMLSRYKMKLAAKWMIVPVRLSLKPRRVILFFLILGLAISAVYFEIIGFTNAISNTLLMRSGNFDALGENAQYVFLKRLASLGILSACFVPALIRNREMSPILILLFVIFAIVHYINSAGRIIILDLIVVPVCFYLYLRRSFVSIALVSIVGVWLIPATILYGKHFVGYVSAIWMGESPELIRFGESDSDLQATLSNFSTTWFSVDAGLRHWWANGPFIAQDTLLAFIGVVPSSVFEAFGLGHLSYHNAEIRMPCVNSQEFSGAGCSIPPYFPGYSAYILPYLGGFAFGFFRYAIFSILEKMWLFAKQSSYDLTWFPYLLFIVVWNLLLLVPATISFAVFIVILLTVYCGVRGMIKQPKRYGLIMDKRSHV